MPSAFSAGYPLTLEAAYGHPTPIADSPISVTTSASEHTITPGYRYDFSAVGGDVVLVFTTVGGEDATADGAGSAGGGCILIPDGGYRIYRAAPGDTTISVICLTGSTTATLFVSRLDEE